MKFLALFAGIFFAGVMMGSAEEKAGKVFELRTYWAAPGKLEELSGRFRDHTLALFTKHGVTNLGYWMPVENTENQLIYLLAYPSREAREASWKALMADAEWQKVFAASEAKGKLVVKSEAIFMKATDFSPEGKLAAGEDGGIFELRTYTATPGNLPGLLDRFREHTVDFFMKHGMKSLWYWELAKGQAGAENTLVYLLAHPSADAATASWAAFRADPGWVEAKAASEKKGGGSLTAVNGVKSVMLKATDYSPLK